MVNRFVLSFYLRKAPLHYIFLLSVKPPPVPYNFNILKSKSIYLLIYFLFTCSSWSMNFSPTWAIPSRYWTWYWHLAAFPLPKHLICIGTETCNLIIVNHSSRPRTGNHTPLSSPAFQSSGQHWPYRCLWAASQGKWFRTVNAEILPIAKLLPRPSTMAR